jgi:hypothetical protein
VAKETHERTIEHPLSKKKRGAKVREDDLLLKEKNNL